MSLTTILVPVRGDGRGAGVIDHAVRLARGFSAHIQVIHCRPGSGDTLPYGVVVPRVVAAQFAQSMATVADGERESMRALFRDAAERHGLEAVEEGPLPRGRSSLGWREVPGRQADVLGTHGRLFDMIAVPRPDRAANLGFNTLYAALSNTGRPVLLCPEADRGTTLPGHVALAWNGSIEATRAVALGAPLLDRAARVTVLTAGRTPEGTEPEALVAMLLLRGIDARVERVPGSGGSDAGPALLRAVEASGADMLLMGAYSHSRGREQLFGGVSQHVVDRAPLPVVLVH